ncbi:MAG TPA: aminotransferase class III-fold pyridoxal phosphate-dependent enzyme [Haliangium sp.]|nr:aminotransferase class III-fold pyridoxal phosphate-dependent enzyme [Haliangium sp.]
MSDRKVVVSARNATLFNADGSTHTDLFAANGTLLLGHGNPAVVAALAEQNEKVWITGRLDTDIRRRAIELTEQILPEGYHVAGFYSTGMEAAEFALRASRVLTGRPDFVGFARCMHGKSIATAFLAWDAPYGRALPGFLRLPFPATGQASTALEQLETVIARRETAAVILEAVQGSSGGAVVDHDVCRSLTDLCRAHGTLLVVDEILTGFHRSGPLFFYSRLPLEPDIILAGKSMGNGFPVSAVLMRRGVEIKPHMLPYSTYAENALAAAAVVGTLREMKRLPIVQMAEAVGDRIRSHLSRSAPDSYIATIFGAMCIIDVRDSAVAQRIADTCYQRGVLISHSGSILRLLPPVTIEQPQLEQALDVLDAAIRDSAGHDVPIQASNQ